TRALHYSNWAEGSEELHSSLLTLLGRATLDFHHNFRQYPVLHMSNVCWAYATLAQEM
ncbi:unnamed protein product, partial [Amoebophrya sp. A25]